MEFDIRRAATSPTITLHVTPDVAFNIDRLFEVQKELFEQLGHGGCYSGADVRLKVVDEWVIKAGRVGPAFG